MDLTFKNISSGIADEIYVDKVFIGTVRVDVWNGKWKASPKFKYSLYSKNEVLHTKYDSSYEAGKALATFYESTFNYFEDDEDVTQEFDMRDIFKSYSP
tara:strand:+ start:432 stop:728 length:297 start_codon:yes stop_codon:yes gene_type:complete